MVFVVACGRIGFDSTGDGATTEDGAPGSTPAVPLALPGGGYIESIAIAPDGTWYALNHEAGVFRSDDQQRWVPCGPAPFAASHLSVGADGAVYVADPGLARSPDRCATFTSLDPPGGFAVQAGHRGDELYAVGPALLSRRTGATWTPVPTPLDGQFPWTFATAPGGRSLIGAFSGGLAVSPDATTWTQVTTGLATPNVQEVAVTPTRMYANIGVVESWCVRSARGTGSQRGKTSCGSWTSSLRSPGTTASIRSGS